MLKHNYTSEQFFNEFLSLNSRILNAGSKSTRYGDNCLNIDIQQAPGVDIVADIHALPDDIGTFDAIICTAVLQYCRNPFKVADELYRALKPGGLLFVSAPWIQGYCPDTPDRWRFSADGLREIFKELEIIECEPGIRPGSAFAYLAYQLAEDLTTNRYVNFVARNLVRWGLLPLRWMNTAAAAKNAGSFYLIGRKRVTE